MTIKAHFEFVSVSIWGLCLGNLAVKESRYPVISRFWVIMAAILIRSGSACIVLFAVLYCARVYWRKGMGHEFGII